MSEANAAHEESGSDILGVEFERPEVRLANAPLVAIGNLLIFVTGADRRLIGSRVERARYATTGALMLLTAGQAIYAAATIASMGFGHPASEQLHYGIFYAAFILLIDRSIVAYVPPLVDRDGGTVGSSKGRLGGIGARMAIAVVASLLISEAVLLQFFAPRINERLEQRNVANVASITAGVRANFEQQIDDLKSRLAAADAKTASSLNDYEDAAAAANCQLSGCGGIPPGAGEQYDAARVRQTAAFKSWQQNDQAARALRKELDPKVTELVDQRDEAIAASSGNVRPNDMLAREEAFWHLTMNSGTVAFWRLLLSLLLLGIDLAPILIKLRSGATVHDERTRIGEHLRRRATRRQGHVLTSENGDVEVVDRERTALERDTRLAELTATHELRRLEIDLRKRERTAALRAGYERAGAASARGQALSPIRDPASATINLTPHDTFYGGAAASDWNVLSSATTRLDKRDSEALGWKLGGRWLLEKLLPGADDGSYGTLFLALDSQAEPKREVVVKVTPTADQKLINDLDDLLRHRSWKRETGARVRSRNVGEILDYGEDEQYNVYYIVSPLYTPGSLSQFVRTRRPLHQLGWAMDVVDQVLAGLMDAGGEGLVHLDVKPSNIVLDDTAKGTVVRVIDWGLARYWEQKERSATPVARGSVYYASPEQLIYRKKGWDTPLSDLYSVGAVFYWLLSGYAPYERGSGGGPDAFEFKQRIVEGERPDSLGKLVPDLPPPLISLVHKWLSLDAKDRVSKKAAPRDALKFATNELKALRAKLADHLDMMVGLIEQQPDELVYEASAVDETRRAS